MGARPVSAGTGRCQMRNKLALIIALASFGVVTALGVGFAGAEEVSTTSGEAAAPRRRRPPALADAAGLLQRNRRRRRRPGRHGRPRLRIAARHDRGNGAPGEPDQQQQPERRRCRAGRRRLQVRRDDAANGRRRRRQPQREPRRRQRRRRQPAAASTPRARPAGDQPHAEGANGGSQFGSGGPPTAANPTTTIAPFGPAPIGVPNFVIDSFEIPPFLLPIYQACGTEYGIPWEVLASINKIETGFGTNLNVSSAGAVGWMQFLPSSWEKYGLDANGDGRKDPYNPVDAICAAAHYLKVGGGTKDLYNAILAYNHADWYVQEVLALRPRLRQAADRPGRLADRPDRGRPLPGRRRRPLRRRHLRPRALKRSAPGAAEAYGNAAEVISSSPTRRGINIFAAEGAPVVAVNDGVIAKMGNSASLGKYVVLEDAYGNRYTYAELGQIVRHHRSVVMPTGKEKRMPVDSRTSARGSARCRAARRRRPAEPAKRRKVDSADQRRRRNPEGRVEGHSRDRAGPDRPAEGGVDPHINFSIRPAGRGAPRIDPKPILDGWKLLEATAIYRANGKNPLADDLGGAGVLLLSKEELQKRVLADNSLEIYECGREDIATGQIDRRVLAMLEYLVSKGFKLTITSLKCGHSILTAPATSPSTHRGRGRHRRHRRRPGHRPPGPRDARPTS